MLFSIHRGIRLKLFAALPGRQVILVMTGVMEMGLKSAATFGGGNFGDWTNAGFFPMHGDGGG